MAECQRPEPPGFLDGYNYCDRCGARNDSPCGLESKMEIDSFPPGLLSRRMFPIDQERVVVEEKWNIDVPGCPLVRNPFVMGGPQPSWPIRIRQVTMSEKEFFSSKIPLRDEQRLDSK